MTASPSSPSSFPTRNTYGLNPISSVTPKPKLQIVSSQGQLQVYSSPYRGSFSFVLSEALRSAGLGSKVLIAQFLKGGVDQGPNNSTSLCGSLEWLRPNIYGCINNKKQYSENVQAIKEVWETCQDLMANNALDKLVLDEVGLAIEFDFIKEADLIASLKNCNDSIDVILTGPSLPPKVFEMADQITQLRCSK